MGLQELKQLMLIAIEAAINAGAEIMEVYRGKLSVTYKEDQSPLTLADKKSHEIIAAALEKKAYPVLSEEGKQIPYEERKSWQRFWLVDPLDGTKEFIKKNGEFTVNIAFIEDKTPLMGLIYVPAQECLYFSICQTDVAYKKKCATKTKNLEDFDDFTACCKKLPLQNKKDAYTIVASRSHLSPETQAYVQDMKKEHGRVQFISAGSALKFCLLAEGKADVYPRFAPTMEWDTAAGHAILKGLGKQLIDMTTQKPMIYNRKQLKNNWFLAK